MSKDSIRLSPKYGLNPTIPSCFWCGKPKNMIALMGRIGDGRRGEDEQAPMGAVIDYEPCDECASQWKLGFTIIEVTQQPQSTHQPPIQDNLYPTSRIIVIKREAAERIFDPKYTQKDRLYCDVPTMEQLISMLTPKDEEE